MVPDALEGKQEPRGHRDGLAGSCAEREVLHGEGGRCVRADEGLGSRLATGVHTFPPNAALSLGGAGALQVGQSRLSVSWLGYFRLGFELGLLCP